MLAESKGLIKNNAFWTDLAKFIVQNKSCSESNPLRGSIEDFLSPNFIYATSNHTEMLGVLSFMSLPFDQHSHKYQQPEGKKSMTIKTRSSALIFLKEIKEGKQ